MDADIFWGADLASTKIALAAYGEGVLDTEFWVTAHPPALGPRMTLLYRRGLRLATTLAALHPPTALVVENPNVRGAHTTMVMGAGAALAGIAAAIDCPILDLRVAQWRRPLGIVNSKSAAIAYARTLVDDDLRAALMGEDELEALAMAKACQLLYVRTGHA